jgi:cyclohexanone monooxygenase
MFNLDHVSLVDLWKTPILRMTPARIETSEGELEFDAVVFATGFDALTGAAARIDLTGRGGVTLRDKWSDGPQTYLGIASSYFPNLFFVTGPGSPGPLSAMVKPIEQHVDWIADCLAYLRDRGFVCIEADLAHERDWSRHVEEVAGNTLYPRANSWYVGANVRDTRRPFRSRFGCRVSRFGFRP